jgi:hypothetical protein
VFLIQILTAPPVGTSVYRQKFAAIASQDITKIFPQAHVSRAQNVKPNVWSKNKKKFFQLNQ